MTPDKLEKFGAFLWNGICGHEWDYRRSAICPTCQDESSFEDIMDCRMRVNMQAVRAAMEPKGDPDELTDAYHAAVSQMQKRQAMVRTWNPYASQPAP